MGDLRGVPLLRLRPRAAWRIGALLGILLFATAEGRAGEGRAIAVVASRRWSALEAVSLTDLERIYLGKRRRLAGERVVCVHLPPGDPVRGAFRRAVLRKSEPALRAYWIEQALTGGYLPPIEVASEEAMLRAVSERPGILGYVDSEKLAELPIGTIRIVPLRIDGRRVGPDDSAYPIRLPVEPADGSARASSADDEPTHPP